MKELVILQPLKRILQMIHKMKYRYRNCIPNNIREGDEGKLYYEIIQKGTYTSCILTRDSEIVGLGMTKRDRKDKYNAIVALDVCIWKAIKDYIVGIKPEWEHSKME